MLAEAERCGATDEHAAASAADWVAVETRQTRIAARSDLKLTKALDQHQVLAEAISKGRVNIAQARAILKALDKLPTSGQFAITPEQRRQAEEHLVELAADYDAQALTLLGRHLFEVVAPDLAEQFDGKALEAEEAAALRRTTFEMREDDEDCCHGRFRIPTLHGHILRKLILALDSPARPSHTDTDAAGVCTLDTGGQISAAEARRLACTAGIIPVVLGSRSEPLDVGRKNRYHREPQRIAMAIRDRGCTAVDCDRPPGMCHAHHDIPW